MCCCDFTQPRRTVDEFLFLLVPFYGSILLMAIAYTASQAAIVLTLTLFNRLNFIKVAPVDVLLVFRQILLHFYLSWYAFAETTISLSIPTSMYYRT